MKKMTIKLYAIKHRLSLFSVMKMVKSDKVESEAVQENGREVIYILIDEDREKNIKNSIVPIKEEELTLDQMVKVLQKEVKFLREEIENLQKRL